MVFGGAGQGFWVIMWCCLSDRNILLLIPLKHLSKAHGIFLCSRYEQDSGHDSGSEDTFFDSSQPCTLVTLGMKKFFIPATPAAPKDPASRILPLPSSLGVCLDCDRGRVGFYDAGRMKCLYECEVDCSGLMYPAFALMGGAAVHLEEAVTAKDREYHDDI